MLVTVCASPGRRTAAWFAFSPGSRGVLAGTSEELAGAKFHSVQGEVIPFTLLPTFFVIMSLLVSLATIFRVLQTASPQLLHRLTELTVRVALVTALLLTSSPVYSTLTMWYYLEELVLHTRLEIPHGTS